MIDRILFFEEQPIVCNLNKITIGAKVETRMANDIAAEEGAIKSYNEGIQLCVSAADNGTRELLESTLKDKELHLDWLEMQLDQIEKMGIQAHLSDQLS